MTPLFRKFLGMNWFLFLLVAGLLGFGVFAIYSATWMRADAYLVNSWQKQTIWIAFGIVVYFVVSLMDYKWVLWGGIPIYVGSVAALILTEFIGTEVYGAKSWLRVGPLTLQTSQPAILGGVLVVAMCLSQLRHIHPFLRLCVVGGVVALPALLVLKQPDLGSAIVWGPVIMCMLFMARIPLRYLTVIILLGVTAVPLVLNFGLKEYQRDRITTFIDPSADPLNTGWTINQSLTAIGSGGLQGKGFKTPNTLNELGFLPATIVHNDFIFSVIAEQHGFIGGVLLVGAFTLLLLTMLLITMQAKDVLGRLICAGFVGLIFAHTYMNIGMTISLTPITGLPLPLISYGGSFVVIVLFGLGLMQSVWVHRHAS